VNKRIPAAAASTAPETPATSPTAEPASAASPPASLPVAALPPAAAADQNSSTDSAAPGLSAATTAARPATGPKIYGAAEPGRVIIRATGDCWVQVRDRSDAVVLQRVLHAGDTFQVPDTQGLTMRTGNGSALQVAVDGRPAPAIGGTVRHNVLLDPERLATGTAVTE